MTPKSVQPTLRRGLLALCGLAALSSCAGSRAGAAQPSPSPSPLDVSAITATVGTLRPALTIPGAIAPYQSVALSNSITEPAQAVYVQEGDHVRQGQVIAQLAVDDLTANLNSALQTANADRAQLSEARYNAQLAFAQAPQQVAASGAAVEQAKATLQEAIINLERDQQLVSQGYLPRQLRRTGGGRPQRSASTRVGASDAGGIGCQRTRQRKLRQRITSLDDRRRES